MVEIILTVTDEKLRQRELIQVHTASITNLGFKPGNIRLEPGLLININLSRLIFSLRLKKNYMNQNIPIK